MREQPDHLLARSVLKQSAQNIGSDEPRYRLLRRLRQSGVSESVIAVMMEVPRDRFVPVALRRYAWIDESLPIGKGQTISQPSLVGHMIDQLKTQPHHHVLDIGTGSGYQTAILAKLVESVVGVERIPSLCIAASALLQELGCRNVQVFDADDELGWPDLAPYDGIIVGAAAPKIPGSLVQQLKVGGRLIIPVGNRHEQQVIAVERTETGTERELLEPVRFVPLIGEEAWQD